MQASLILLLGLFAYSAVSQTAPTPYSVDPSSYSNPDQIFTTKFHLDVLVDFDKQTISGVNMITLQAIKDGIQQVNLDVQGIDISSVIDISTPDTPLTTAIQTPDADLGSVLLITLLKPLATGDVVTLNITYSTNSQQQATSWMTPEQTSSKTLSYLFTQCEPIHCRSVAPLQDTPSLKAPYSAAVKVLAPYQVYMSANSTLQTNDGTFNTFYFDCTVPIPSYLMAMAVGNIVYKSVGNRVGVLTEPTMLDECVSELSDLETYLDKSEAFLTPYIWGTYNILVLPPSFPYGGMENPLLTFASPTIIVGDKSQVYVATHEICHSWTGNQVTCESWSNMWLNEGFTVFEERTVSSQIYGDDFAKCEAILGNSSLYNDINNYGVDNSYSSLYPVLDGHSPDDSFSQLPYEKGFQFLTFLESLITPTEFQTFLRTYINKYSLQSVNYNDLEQTWTDFITANHVDPERTQILDAVDWELWVRTPGYPPVELDFSNPDQLDASNLADAYINAKGKTTPTNYLDYSNFYANQKVIFLLQLIARASEVDLLLLQRIDADLAITKDPNPEIKQRWYPLGIAFNYMPVFEPSHTFVSVQGRMKYLNPIYQTLCQYGHRDLAYEWFNENINFYHPIAVTQLKKMLLQSVSPTEEKMLQRHMKLIKGRRVAQ